MNKRHSIVFAFFSAGLVLCLNSCANHQKLSSFEAAVGRTLNAPKGKALICVYRPSKPFTGLILRPVFINKQHVASTSLGSFVAVPVDPGSYTVQAAAQALIDTPEQRAAYPNIGLKLKAGQSIFIRQTIHGSSSNAQSSIMMLQTGGAPIPILIGGGLPPFGAELVSRETGRLGCAGLKQVAADPLDTSISQ
jgi:Protein of unknown function (DUF2846)